jgi:hypothetical protein
MFGRLVIFSAVRVVQSIFESSNLSHYDQVKILSLVRYHGSRPDLGVKGSTGVIASLETCATHQLLFYC